MKKGIIIGFIVIAALIAAYFVYDSYYNLCPPVRNPEKFPDPWDENNRNSGNLAKMAKQYATPILGDSDISHNASVVGGFFKGIDVYPSFEAAKFYKRYLINYLNSNNALPWWNMKTGELLCK